MPIATHSFISNIFEQNCVILFCTKTKQAAVIDPGGDIEQIISYLSEHKLHLDKILISHGHLDHLAEAQNLATHFSVKIYGPHSADNFLLESLAEQSRAFNFPSKCERLVPDRFLNDGDKINIGDEIIDVFHCPGHTPGHVVFYNKTSNLLFSGDVLFYRSIGRTDLLLGNYEQLINSIKSKLLTLPENTVVIPGHGKNTSIAQEKAYNPFFKKTE